MENIIKESLALRKEGLFTSAYEKLNTARLDRDIKATLNVWKKELLSYNWNMTRKDKERTSSNPSFGEWTHLSEVWKARINYKIPQGLLPNIPSLISADDILIAPDSSMTSFIGLWTNNGEIIESDLFLSSLLSYTQTPVYLPPFFLFAIDGSIFKLSISNTILTNQIIDDERVKPIQWSPPVATKDKAIFAFHNSIFVYSNKPKFTDFSLEKEGDFLRSPVVFNETPIFLSKYGEILALKEGIERIKEPFEDIICGSPCLS
ncbi:MAG: hypothetical protein AB1297_08865, partial [bacterium]